MNTNLPSQVSSPRALSGEAWAAIAGAVGSALLLAKKLLGPKAAKPEPLSRAEFYAEMLAMRERIHADHLAMLDKLDATFWRAPGRWCAAVHRCDCARCDTTTTNNNNTTERNETKHENT